MTPEHLKNGTCMQDAARYAAHGDHPLRDVPWQALLAARQALRDAQLTNDAEDYEMIGPVADAILAAGLKKINGERKD